MFITGLNGLLRTANCGRIKISRTTFIIVLLLFSLVLIHAAKSHPPLVPEGEKIENIQELIKNINRRSPVQTLAFSPNGKTLASGSEDFTIRLWDVESGKEIHILQGHSDYVFSVVFSPDGQTLASGSGDNTIRLWDVAYGKKDKILQGHNNKVSSVIFSPDRKTLASGSWDNTIRLWDVESGKPICTLQGHIESVSSVVFSPDGKILASRSGDDTISLWDVASGNNIKTLQEHNGYDFSVVFSPDGKILAYGSRDGTIHLWDVETGEVINTLQSHSDSVCCMVFGPDGKTLATMPGDDSIRLWDVASGNAIVTLRGHTGFVYSVIFSTDRKAMVSRSLDRTIRLWDVASGKNINTLQGHKGFVHSVVVSPDVKTMAYGADDGTVKLHRVKDGKLIWIFMTGSKGNWLAVNSQNYVWRYDDGTYLVNKDKKGNISPVLPPKPKENGKLSVFWKPESLKTNDGEATEFNLILENIGKGKLYWINISLDLGAEQENIGRRLKYLSYFLPTPLKNFISHSTLQKFKSPLVFHPPPDKVILEPGEAVKMPCKVSAFAQYINPFGQENKLFLKITSVYSTPLNVAIPVSSYVPSLDIVHTRLEKQDSNLLLVSIKNVGRQPFSSETEFIAVVDKKEVARITQKEVKINVDESIDMPFAIPDTLEIDKNSKLNLIAKKMSYPVHVWEFKGQPIILPKPGWYVYALFGILILALLILIYYMSFYSHPLVIKLFKSPEDLFLLSPQQLSRAKILLKLTRILEGVLFKISIPKILLEQSIAFYKHWDLETRCKHLAERLEAKCESLPDNNIHLYKLKMGRDFMLNMDQCLLAFPPGDMPANEVLSHIKKIEGAFYQVCLFITFNEQQQAELRKISLNLDNLFVTPQSKELTHLLLSPSPLNVFAHLTASQVKVTRISPFQTKGGVDKESVFFGRVQLLTHIMQREPANYLLVGGRQLGKSSLLKAIERRYKDDRNIKCHYLHLQSSEITDLLAGSLDLPGETNLQELLKHLRQSPGGKRRLFLIDEADKFIASESQTGCTILQHFRSLSEEGQCYFIFAGFWNLYHAATLEYQSPIKNFGEILTIEALETDACRQLATKPMNLLNIHYESDELIEILLRETGQRPNLIAIICNEMLKNLEMTQRVIRHEQLEQAMDSNEVRSSLSGWERLTPDETSNRLDRIIVYATINQETFTQTRLMQILDSHGCSYEPEAVKQSLARLELAFILKRRKQGYFYCVPLFKKMVQQQDPEDLLNRELKALRER